MGRLMLLVALCVLPALVSAGRPVSQPFVLQGRVYCDTCRAGFETSATTYIAGNHPSFLICFCKISFFVFSVIFYIDLIF